MKPVEIKPDIFWVGAVDWGLRDFHGYSTEKGTTFNAYLVKDDKTVLFDTVKADFVGDLVANIKAVTEPDKIDYIVVNHAEMDHSGSLPQIIELVKPEKILCTEKCKESLISQFHNDSWPIETIKEGDTLDLGSRSVRFFDSKMLHWPESMVSYIEKDKLLISNDIFGQHYASSLRFDDQAEQGELRFQTAKYYANIFLPFSNIAQKFLAKLKDNQLDIDMLAVDHGFIWRSDLDYIFDAYDRWSRHETVEKAVIIYGTMWGSTHQMARAIARGIASEDVKVDLYDLKINHRSDIITDALEARAVILGSPVMNNNIVPAMGDMLTYAKGLKLRGKIGAAFGSFGWSPKGVKMLNEAMEEMRWEIVHEGLSMQYVPDDSAVAECQAFGAEIAKKIKG